MTVEELIAALSKFPSGVTVTVWDPLLDDECHVNPNFGYSSAYTVLIDSAVDRVTEEDLT